MGGGRDLSWSSLMVFTFIILRPSSISVVPRHVEITVDRPDHSNHVDKLFSPALPLTALQNDCSVWPVWSGFEGQRRKCCFSSMGLTSLVIGNLEEEIWMSCDKGHFITQGTKFRYNTVARQKTFLVQEDTWHKRESAQQCPLRSRTWHSFSGYCSQLEIRLGRHCHSLLSQIRTSQEKAAHSWEGPVLVLNLHLNRDSKGPTYYNTTTFYHKVACVPLENLQQWWCILSSSWGDRLCLALVERVLWEEIASRNQFWCS